MGRRGDRLVDDVEDALPDAYDVYYKYGFWGPTVRFTLNRKLGGGERRRLEDMGLMYNSVSHQPNGTTMNYEFGSSDMSTWRGGGPASHM